ncbi:hypothetical protein E4U39_005387 [Claviceps sp. Clav50 group G5]|nr:hypothetical protein E4U39_005387 [Claviceps sp. Clav50 group G5]
MHSEKVLRAVAKDRRDGTFCDLDIVCGETRFHVHRVFVCSHSPVIQAACLGPWKVKSLKRHPFGTPEFPLLTHLQEGACGVFEIKESSDALVGRMLDYIYTGTYDDLPSNAPTQDGKRSSTKVAKLGPAPHVLLHAKMMELGDKYLVDGLGLFANERFGILLKSETTRNILVDIVPEVYAMEFKSCRLIRKALIDSMRRILAHRTLSAEVEGSLEDATRDVPEFTRDLFKSFKDMPVLGHCTNCGGNTKTVPVAPLQLKCLLCRRGGAWSLHD